MFFSSTSLALMLSCFIGVALSDPPLQCQQVSLNSNGFNYRRQVQSNVAEVRSMSLISQRSRSPCINGSSYGFYGQSVWVNNGCRANFNVCSVPGANTEITCSSRNYKTAVCNTGHQIRAVSIKRHISNSPCVEGFSYRTTGSQLQVFNGCRATFIVGYWD
ncbi:D-galacturonic acid binding lectin [Plakobranchus ocellatus]|uniref:D-galacturonic acid binding lectin n=1 Tax=Plakobranchus ocellatus TaxID=259542 RepID=A0AAV3XX63_9GAST|nr:D-galacturonic acid binding lectin [Plakobranchus ocellatus]